MKATPRPWEIEKEGRDHLHIVNSNIDYAIASLYADPIDEETEANAQLIITAVNNHDKLIEALKAIVENDDDESTLYAKINHAESLLAELK